MISWLLVPFISRNDIRVLVHQGIGTSARRFQLRWRDIPYLASAHLATDSKSRNKIDNNTLFSIKIKISVG